MPKFDDRFRQFNGRLLASIRGMLMSRTSKFSAKDVEDLAQDTWFTAYQRLHTFDDTQEFFPWLRGIAHYQMLNWLRKRSNWEIPTEDAQLYQMKEAQQTKEPSNHGTENEADPTLIAAIESLPKTYSSVLKLHLEEYSVEEIAEALNLSASAVRKRLQRGVERLKEKLSNDSGIISQNWRKDHEQSSYTQKSRNRENPPCD